MKHTRVAICLVVAAALAVAASVWAQPKPERVRPNPNFVFEPDIVYTTIGETPLHLDLARPGRGDGPFPAVVAIHGGAWRGGNKNRYRPFVKHMAERGYVAITVQYRLSPRHTFPAHVEDVKCAVRYLRSRAKELNIDPDRIGAMGESAGGHLSLLLGVTDEKAGLEGGGGYAEHSSKVRAVVNFCGPADLTLDYDPKVRDLITAFIGGTPETKAEAHRLASPVTHLTPDDAAILTIHGTMDNVVPYEQAKILDAACKKAGVPHELFTVEGGGHGLQGEQLLKAIEQTVTFLDKHLNAGE